MDECHKNHPFQFVIHHEKKFILNNINILYFFLPNTATYTNMVADVVSPQTTTVSNSTVDVDNSMKSNTNSKNLVN